MNYDEWEKRLPRDVTGDSLWKIEAYRLGLFAGYLAWRLARARMLVETTTNEASYVDGSKLLNDIIRSYPLLTEPRVLLAAALVRMNRIDGAIEQLTVATKLASTTLDRGYTMKPSKIARVSPSTRS